MQKVKTYIFENKVLLLILVVAAFLRFYKLDFQSMWLDELYTMAVTNPDLSWKEFHKEVVSKESFPFLYFIVLKGFYFLFGYTSLVARLVSVLAGIASVYALYLLGKKIYSKKAGLAAAALVSVSTYHIQISQDARAYTFYFLFVCLSFYGFLRFLEKRTWKEVFLYALWSSLLVNFNFFAPLNLAAQGLIVFAVLFLIPKQDRLPLLYKFATATALIVGAFLLNIQKLKVLLGYKKFWVAPPAEDSFSKIFKNLLGNSEVLVFLISVLVFFYFWKVFTNKEPKKLTFTEIKENKLFYSFCVFSLWFLVLFLVLMIKSYGVISYLLTRYFLSTLPIILLGISIAILNIEGKITKRIVLFTLLSFMLVHLIVVQKQYTKITKAQYREAAQFVKQHHKEPLTIYSNQEYWYKFYFRPKRIKKGSLNSICDAFKKDSTKLKSFWYVDAYKRFDSVKRSTKEYLDKRFLIKQQYKGYRAWATYYELKQTKK